MLNDFDSLFGYLTGDYEDLLRTENFQSKFMQDLPRLLWSSERMDDIGDFVLLFPNPDTPSMKHMSKDFSIPNGLTWDEAQEYFHKVFDNTYIFPYKKQFNEAFKQAFKSAFIELDEYVYMTSEEQKKFDKKQKKLEEKSKNQNLEKSEMKDLKNETEMGRGDSNKAEFISENQIGLLQQGDGVSDHANIGDNEPRANIPKHSKRKENPKEKQKEKR